MKILLLAPQPFYQERGTPIAVDLLLRTLSDRGHHVDALVYHEGSDVSYPNVALHRIPAPPGIRNLRPGFSFKKIVCDFLMFWKAWGMVRKFRPDVIHAVEESVFIAWVLHRLHGIPYVYDMDSSLPDQIVEKSPRMGFLLRWMHRITRAAVFPALLVAPVCNALAEVAQQYRPKRVVMLRDISLLKYTSDPPQTRVRQNLTLQGTCFMYVGNLEGYQGIDLLLEAFARLQQPVPRDALVIVGGHPSDIARYQARASALGIAARTHFLGPRPVDQMVHVLAEADVLVSPRIKGGNTPMKIYSYLDSGKPVVATDLPTHTQVLTPEVALLAPPEPAAFADAMRRASGDPALRADLGRRGRALIEAHYNLEAFRRGLDAIYEHVAHALEIPAASRVTEIGNTRGLRAADPPDSPG